MMTDQAEISLKKQYKLLKKAIKSELKKSLKADESMRNNLMNLSALDIEKLANKMVTQALGQNEVVTNKQVVVKIAPKPTNMSFALKPLKKSPCKQCPALSGGLCQCAIKQNNKKPIRLMS